MAAVTTDREVLQKAIEKAIENGWEKDRFKVLHPSEVQFDHYEEEPYTISYRANNSTIRHSFYTDFYSENDLIFNHDFAKALWGEELHHEIFIVPKELNKRFAGTKDLDIKPTWQYHLQQMVISPNPIDYLRDYLVEYS